MSLAFITTMRKKKKKKKRRTSSRGTRERERGEGHGKQNRRQNGPVEVVSAWERQKLYNSVLSQRGKNTTIAASPKGEEKDGTARDQEREELPSTSLVRPDVGCENQHIENKGRKPRSAIGRASSFA